MGIEFAEPKIFLNVHKALLCQSFEAANARPFTDRLSQSDAEMLYYASAGIGDGRAEVGGGRPAEKMGKVVQGRRGPGVSQNCVCVRLEPASDP